MAGESLIGAQSSTLDQQSLAIINEYLNDTVGGTARTSTVGGTTLVLGSGHNFETQGVLVPKADAAVTGAVNDGLLIVSVELPKGVGFAFEGLQTMATPTQAQIYLNTLIDTAMPATSTNAITLSERASLLKAVETVVGNSTTNAVVRVVTLTDENQPGAGHQIVLNASSANINETVAINIGFAQGRQIVLSGVEKAIVVGSGDVKVDNPNGAMVVGDATNQHITGGTGADTIVGGGGNDTLTGGGGNDEFAFQQPGHYTITDFTTSDKLAFNFAGIHNIAELSARVTSVNTSVQGQVTYNFGADASITLVGVTAAQVTESLIHFVI